MGALFGSLLLGVLDVAGKYYVPSIGAFIIYARDGRHADPASARLVRARRRAMSVAAATATTDRLAAHLQRRARWRWLEIAFWLAVLAAHLRIAVARGDHQRNADRRPVCSVARSHSRTGRHRLARPRGVLWPWRLYRGDPREPGIRRPPARARLRRRRRRPCRPCDRAAAAARRRLDAADGDDGRRADARRARQPQRLAHRRRGRAQLLDRAGARPVPDRLHRAAQRGALQLRGPVPACSCSRAGSRTRRSACRWRRSARTACALAPSASRQPTHRRDLYVCGGLRGRGGRAARADDADRLARPVRLPSLGRRHADADHRRRRLSLWRHHRRRGVHRAAGT